MGKIINFVNSCKECRYSQRNGSCSSENYIKNQFRVVVELGRCPYFEEKTVKEQVK